MVNSTVQFLSDFLDGVEEILVLSRYVYVCMYMDAHTLYVYNVYISLEPAHDKTRPILHSDSVGRVHASNALNALIKLASPSTYACNMYFPWLRREGVALFAPFLKDKYPSIAIPCWDHSSRTSLRNLMNMKLTVTAGHNDIDCGIRNALVATIQDLHLLKNSNPNFPVKYGDITPFLRQNCDAT